MASIRIITLFLLVVSHGYLPTSCSPVNKNTRAIDSSANHGRRNGVTAPLMGDEIDLENMEGVDQLTKLVLLKTDSLPDESDRLDARYLNSLMETLYTGLRKPFKSVSADILGIFPTLDFLNISCDLSREDDNQKNHLVGGKRRRSSLEPENTRNSNSVAQNVVLQEGDPLNNESMLIDSEASPYSNYKSSVQVCKAVTSDCLSMNDLVQILPPSITTSNTLLVRLCPVILFRLISNICRHENELISAYHHTNRVHQQEQNQQQQQEDSSEVNNNGNQQPRDKAAISLSTLQILRTLQNSDEAKGNKRPQKLHKKLKTQTNYKNNGRLNAGSLKQHGVDEQLLKIRLKLSEPSIEKVWLFSLLFVILSIVVSMGGLIVLPFVKKTTRRRILTLFEGLAVGGLTGSATLHMFPQAFGLVDENYHRYFWRIFVVFLGIYLCYLCERTIKILKVVRAKMRRRSRASLIDMDFRYGFHSINRAIASKDNEAYYHPNSNSFEFVTMHPDALHQHMKTGGSGGSRAKQKDMSSALDSHSLYMSVTSRGSDKKRTSQSRKDSKPVPEGSGRNDQSGQFADADARTKKRKSKKSSSPTKGRDNKRERNPDDELHTNNTSGLESPIELDQSMGSTRQRLIRCLKSVRSQFSPVYAVFNQPANDGDGELKRTASVKSKRSQDLQIRSNEEIWNQGRNYYSPRRDRLSENIHHQHLEPLYERPQDVSHSSITKRQAKHKEIETMLYHRNLMEQHKRRDTNSGPRAHYPQQRGFADVNDLVGERQDQNNPARMSVDTVSWMILFGDGLLNVIDGLSIGAAFERNILAGISISVAVMLEEVTHRLGTTAILIRTGLSIKQSFLCTFLSACALFPGMIVGIMLSDATDEATPYIFCAAGGIFLYTGLVDVMKEMNRSIENAMRKDIKTTLKIFALQNVGIILAVIFLSFLALYEPDFEEYQKILNNN